ARRPSEGLGRLVVDGAADRRQGHRRYQEPRGGTGSHDDEHRPLPEQGHEGDEEDRPRSTDRQESPPQGGDEPAEWRGAGGPATEQDPERPGPGRGLRGRPEGWP